MPRKGGTADEGRDGQQEVLLWSSAFYERLLGSMRSAVHLQLRVELVVLAGLEESTLTQYGLGLKRFTESCDQEQISEDERVPASEFLLCAFALVIVLEVHGTARPAIS